MAVGGFQKLDKPRVRVCRWRQIIGKQGRIDLRHLKDTRFVQIHLNDHQSRQQRKNGHRRQQGLPPAHPLGAGSQHGAVTGPVHRPCGMHDGNGLLAPGQCLHARGAQAFADVVGQLLRAFRQAQGHAASEMLGVAFVRWRVAVVVHSLIPLAFNALLRVFFQVNTHFIIWSIFFAI